jgi:hypothetical protein
MLIHHGQGPGCISFFDTQKLEITLKALQISDELMVCAEILNIRDGTK